MRYPIRATRFDSVSPFVAPENAVRVAEKRVGGMVERFNFAQTFSGALKGAPPRPTLLDIAVSAYLQGIEDTVQTCVMKNINLGGSDEHEHGRGESIREAGTGGVAEVSGRAGMEGDRPEPAVGDVARGTRSDGAHAPEQEFSMPLW
jgi:hypothetical protein